MSHQRIARTFTVSVLFAAMLPIMNASAAGFQLGEHGATGTGNAHSSGAAALDDASVVATNIAGMAFFDKAMFTAVATYIHPNAVIKNLDTGVKDKAIAGEAIAPEFFYVAPINDQWSYGLGAYTNFGFVTDYSNTSGITPVADLSDIKTYNLSYNLAYKAQENLSFGLGVNAVYIDAKLTTTLPTPYPLNVPGIGSLTLGPGSILDMSGDDWGFGWKAGAMWEPVDGTRLGLSYHSTVKTKLEGKAKSDVFVGQVPGVIPSYNGKGSVDIKLPDIAELSIWQDINDQWAVHASYMWTGWSTFEELAPKLDSGESPAAVKQNYQDSSRIAVGATYKYDQKWTFRAGYAYDNSPVTNDDRHFTVPDGDRQLLAFGTSYQLDKDQRIDFGYAYLKTESVEIEDKLEGSVAGNNITLATIRGRLTDGPAHLWSLQYNHSF
ncbi:outer membrane protein transport protein [Sansalvadorimonas sp. 2012CJ34-2]|uniref:Outer membrane protein transport protein n=1 Tax=Parendozoicomonas callyspongiae TaxID=2942213 RepID=A0ABT0PB82_9GAMM|nr:outer membrane protein transport protein [Sansalvadorimonas sp. 2012CJ34-2]MCL6268638.1 outer membrane protein transport protein [Sansalvadorimonas sp. 2012CJ34-2]